MRDLAIRAVLVSLTALFPVGLAAETATYTYDPLGRLTAASLNHGTVVSSSIGYDPADNRTSYQVQISGGSQAQISPMGGSNAGEGGAASTITPTFTSAVIAPALPRMRRPGG